MTVKELIDALEEFPEDTPVVTPDTDGLKSVDLDTLWINSHYEQVNIRDPKGQAAVYLY